MATFMPAIFPSCVDFVIRVDKLLCIGSIDKEKKDLLILSHTLEILYLSSSVNVEGVRY